MKKYIVIGNPINHSLSPKLHNFWFKDKNINAIYEKKKTNVDEIANLILDIKEKKINGINVTVPFKKVIIPFLDELSEEANSTQSVNTIYLDNDKLIGHNTDITGFELGLKIKNFDVVNKKVLILGAGGVVPSIIFALNKMKVSRIILSNRTKEKAEKLRDTFNNLTIVDWGDVPDFDMIINATSVGLNKDDRISVDLSKIGKNKIFYDVIYSPEETNFLRVGKKFGHRTENGKMMFIFQAQAAFKIWHGVLPEVNNETIKLLNQ